MCQMKQTLKRSKATPRTVIVGGTGGQAAVKKTGRSVVSHWTRGPARQTAEFSPARLIDVLRVGLPVHELDELRARLDVPMERLSAMLGISKSTLHRRKTGGRLAPAESDRLVRFARLLGKAIEVLESEESARRWLTSPQIGLGGAVPLEYAETEVGAREVEDLLGRIEYGVYS
jgi:putative toxin-antitoxin system antitoxin component (TIGR02293 family)